MKFEIGQHIEGTIKNITPYGAFVDIGDGKIGMIHLQDFSVARIKSPYERVKIGQNVNIVVKSIDEEKDRINLSYKESYGTWEENADKFTTGMVTTRHSQRNRKE